MVVAVENGEVVIMMENVDEVEAADEVIEEVVFDSNDITFLLLKFFFSGGHGPRQDSPTPIPA